MSRTAASTRHSSHTAWIPLAALCLGACTGEHPLAEERARRAARARGDVIVATAWPWELRKDIRYGDGLDMAVDEVNSRGGVGGRRLQLLRFDDKESVDAGLLVAQQIAANPDIVAVIGHLQSFVSVPAAAVYDLAGLLMIAPTATDPELTSRGYRRVFRATFTDRDMGRQMAEFADRSGFRRVAIEYIRNAYGRGLANAFEERASEVNVAVMARQSYDPTEQVSERTFEPTLREWQHLELDAIFLAGETPSAALFVGQARARGIGVPIFGGDALGTSTLMSLAGRAAEGTIVATLFHPDEPRDEVDRFVADFQKRYGVLPDAGSALGFDAVGLLAEGIRQAGTVAPDAVAKTLHSLQGWRGVTGAFSFDERGDVINRPLVKMVVHDRKFVLFSERAPAAR